MIVSSIPDRRGIALFSALSLTALLGLLLAGAVASATLTHRAIRASLSDAPLLGAADYAIGAILADPLGFGLTELPLGRPTRFDVALAGSPLKTDVIATRLPSGVYWLVGDARTTDSDSARRRVNLIARTVWLGPPPTSPFVARGPTALHANILTIGDSLMEPDCAADSVPAPVQTDDSSAVFDGPARWSALASASGVRVVHGDTVLTSGGFEGILMVDGSLTIDGAVELRGLVVARGRIRSSAGLRLTGALISQASGPSSSIDISGATIRFAPCLVHQLLRKASAVRVVRGRGWTELF